MAEFILKDWYGKEQTFNKETIFVKNKAGELMPFTHGTAEPLEVTENGTYEVPEGVCGYSPVTVAVPAPEIKLQEKTITENGEYTADEGFDGMSKAIVNIAASGGGTLVGAFGRVTGTGAAITIEHNLGVVPLFIIISALKLDVAKGSIRIAYGISEAAATATGITSYGSMYTYYNEYSSVLTTSFGNDYIDKPYNPINSANETTFNVGRGTYNLLKDATYNWIAIGLKTE